MADSEGVVGIDRIPASLVSFKAVSLRDNFESVFLFALLALASILVPVAIATD